MRAAFRSTTFLVVLFIIGIALGGCSSGGKKAARSTTTTTGAPVTTTTVAVTTTTHTTTTTAAVKSAKPSGTSPDQSEIDRAIAKANATRPTYHLTILPPPTYPAVPATVSCYGEGCP